MVKPKKNDFDTDISPPSSSTSGTGGDDSKVTLVTKEGFEKLKEELINLKDVKRKEVAERLKEAISYGDLSENAEYEEAKNEQAFVEGRIMELEEKIKFAKIIDEKIKHGAVVQLGSKVTVQNLTSKNKKEQQYTIVGSTEADPLDARISNVSPVGRALLERNVGETVKVPAPSGVLEYKIIKVQ